MTTQQFGICSWTLGIEELDPLMRQVAKMGLNSIQYCEPMTRFNAEDVQQSAQAHGLDILIYDPFDCRPSDKNGEPGLTGAVNFYRQVIDYAHALGCPATIQGLSAWTTHCTHDKQAREQLNHSVREVYEYAQKQGVALVYEPCNLYEVPFIHTVSDWQGLLKETECHDIRLLMDSFHMNIGEHAPLKAAEEFAQHNAIFHVSDSNREGIGHGNLPFNDYYHALLRGGFKGPVVFELVLQSNPVNTPPRTAEEMQQLTRQVQESLAWWQSQSH